MDELALKTDIEVLLLPPFVDTDSDGASRDLTRFPFSLGFSSLDSRSESRDLRITLEIASCFLKANDIHKLVIINLYIKDE